MFGRRYYLPSKTDLQSPQSQFKDDSVYRQKGPPATLAKGPERRSGSVDCFRAVRVPLTLRSLGGA